SATIQDKTKMSSQESSEGSALLSSVVHELDRLYTYFNSLYTEFDEMRKTLKVLTSTNESIRELATTTNILSLNASIEANRAGVHGRGFAVIATEVRSLATQTDTLAKGVHDRAEAIEKEVTQLSDVLSSSLGVLTNLKTLTTETSSSFNRI